MKKTKSWEYDVSSLIMTSYLINGPGGKFVVVRVNQGDKEKRLIWATGLCNHVSLVEECEMRLRDGWDDPHEYIEVYTLGGGEIRANHQTRTYYLWGESLEYGMEPDRAQTVADLNEQMIGWTAVGMEPPEGTFDYYLEACRINRARPNPGSWW